MLRNKIFMLVTILIVLIGIVFAIIARTSDYYDIDVEPFDVSAYERCIGTFPFDMSVGSINVGSVSDHKELVLKVEEIWISLYGKYILTERPYKLYYDEVNRVFLVTGTLPENAVGGVANMLIEETSGNVLAVWHSR